MNKLKVGVVFGGLSSEHEVSLQSAATILNGLDLSRYDPILIGVDKTGHWRIYDVSNFLKNDDDPELIALGYSRRSLAIVPGNSSPQLLEISSHQVLDHLDVVIPIIHGSQGEDGCLQGLLRLADVPFVGSDVLGSAICMDKDVSKRLLRDACIPVAPFLTINRRGSVPSFYEVALRLLGSSLFVKPANQGSSVGVSKVENEEQYTKAIALAFEYDDKILIEAAIEGREIECAVLGNEFPVASMCGEIKMPHGFYTYASKYLNGDESVVEVPALIPEEISRRLRALAVEAFQVLGCSGLARVDAFLCANGDIYINEVNTLPGFTSASMYPLLWKGMGKNIQELVTQLIELAIERYSVRKRYRITR